LFAVLPALQQGRPPWLHPTEAQAWLGHAWPALEAVLEDFGTPEGLHWAACWRALAPEVQILAQQAGAAAGQAVLVQRAAFLPSPLAGISGELRHIAVCAAVPGVGGVVVPMGLDIRPLHPLADVADIGPFFTGAAGGAGGGVLSRHGA